MKVAAGSSALSYKGEENWIKVQLSVLNANKWVKKEMLVFLVFAALQKWQQWLWQLSVKRGIHQGHSYSEVDPLAWLPQIWKALIHDFPKSHNLAAWWSIPRISLTHRSVWSEILGIIGKQTELAQLPSSKAATEWESRPQQPLFLRMKAWPRTV